jgi:hypothetical protein
MLYKCKVELQPVGIIYESGIEKDLSPSKFGSGNENIKRRDLRLTTSHRPLVTSILHRSGFAQMVRIFVCIEIYEGNVICSALSLTFDRQVSNVLQQMTLSSVTLRKTHFLFQLFHVFLFRFRLYCLRSV